MSEPKLEANLSTHQAVAEKLRARKNSGVVDINKMVAHTHGTSEETFFVGPMEYANHTKWIDTKQFENIRHQQANKSDEDPIDRRLSDTLLLSSAVYTGDGKPLGTELAKLLLDMQGAGPDNFKLISEAEKVNPPREHLAVEVAQMLNKSSLDCVLWRLLFEAGLAKVLIDSMSTYSTKEEVEWAGHQLKKAEEVVYAFQPLFYAEETAKKLGITFKQGMSLIAEFGTPEAATAQVETEVEIET